MLFGQMHPSWQRLLGSSQKELETIELELESLQNFTPDRKQIMRAFENPVDQVKVLLLGQDPYPTPGVACGLAFAIADGTKKPQSLKNLMKELETDIPGTPNSGNLSAWSGQGVLLLNTALTTETGKPAAHSRLWRNFSYAAISLLAEHHKGKLVCLSLGEHAKKITANLFGVEIVQATHPSPLSANRGFFGSKIYSRVNNALVAKGLSPIDWSC